MRTIDSTSAAGAAGALASDTMPLPRIPDPRMLRAWAQVRTTRFAPARVETLKLSAKSSVYRLIDSDRSRSTIIAKRCPAATARVESLLYGEFLPDLPLPIPRFYGMAPEPDGDFCWLFLEDAGLREYSTADGAHRVLAARWLAALHEMSASKRIRSRLPCRDPQFYLQLLRCVRASLSTLLHRPDLTPAETGLLHVVSAQCDMARRLWDDLEKFCQDWPRAVVHGDFVVKNLRVRAGGGGPVLLVLDWEMAGWGIPATDLAQSVGRCASPDLAEYRSSRGRSFSKRKPTDVRRLARYGNLLRLIHKIFWLTNEWSEQSHRLREAFLRLVRYEPQLAAALRDVYWDPA